MTGPWAEQCAATINDWPGEERRAGKLQDFWDWIDMVRPEVSGALALTVRDMPAGADGDTLLLDFDGGRITGASVRSRSAAEGEAVFLLAGSYADWCEMLDGYDVGKTIMYRKLILEKGDSLKFFMAAFFWTELLAAVQSVPAGTLQPA